MSCKLECDNNITGLEVADKTYTVCERGKEGKCVNEKVGRRKRTGGGVVGTIFRRR